MNIHHFIRKGTAGKGIYSFTCQERDGIIYKCTAKPSWENRTLEDLIQHHQHHIHELIITKSF